MRSALLLIPALALLSGCAGTSVPCSKIPNPPFADRLTLAGELPKDGPVSQRLIEEHAAVLESCGY